jgi:hypothetical protein
MTFGSFLLYIEVHCVLNYFTFLYLILTKYLLFSKFISFDKCTVLQCAKPNLYANFWWLGFAY